MAGTVTNIKIFVAYPDDVAAERAVLDGVVKELNVTWSHTKGIRLEVVDWKTHSWPNFGSDPQAVINEELGEDYDIFIGIMWTRFGEPTPRAGSGTAEEFNRALQRFRENPNQLRIMFYFKVASPPSLNELDLGQLGLIRELKDKVGQEGGLYSEFKDSSDFASSLRLHLTRQVEGWGISWGAKTEATMAASESQALEELPTRSNSEPSLKSENEEDDEGFLDLIERSEESFLTLAEVLSRMTDDMHTYGERLGQRAAELNNLNESNAEIRERKRAINSTAEIMDQYSILLEGELPLYSSTFTAALDSMSRAISIWSEDHMQDNGEATTAHEALQQLIGNLREYEHSVLELRAGLAGIPRITSVFNRSKRRMAAALDVLLAEIARQINLSVQVEAQFSKLVRD
jgi:hypothetical protein